MTIWREHFRRHLNKEFPHDERALELMQPGDGEAEEDDDISLEEVKSAITLLRTRKSPGYDKITAEVINKAGPAMLQMLHKIMRVWLEEHTLCDWSKLLLILTHKKRDTLVTENHKAITLNCIPGKDLL